MIERDKCTLITLVGDDIARRYADPRDWTRLGLHRLAAEAAAKGKGLTALEAVTERSQLKGIQSCTIAEDVDGSQHVTVHMVFTPSKGQR
jgi:hypothetical protein